MHYTEQLANHLQYIQWMEWSAQQNEHWHVFEKTHEGETYEIVLPKKKTPDAGSYLSKTIGVLAGFADESDEQTAERVQYVRKDLLKVKNLVTSQELSMPLNVAGSQVDNIKRLVADSAASDRSPKPFRSGSAPAVSEKMKTHYRFGHTFVGSFGYRVESEVIREMEQLNFDNSDGFERISPVERRVMERIIQGLIHTQSAVDHRSIEPLVSGYMDGFSANMCKALKKIAQNGMSPVEFKVLWSPKVSVDDKLLISDGITITEDHTFFIDSAVDELKAVQPMVVTVEGHIEACSTKANPQASDANRHVVVRWENTDEGADKQPTVMMSLSKNDYNSAVEAHLNWKRVSVTGMLQDAGGKRKLYDLTDFHVLET